MYFHLPFPLLVFIFPIFPKFIISVSTAWLKIPFAILEFLLSRSWILGGFQSTGEVETSSAEPVPKHGIEAVIGMSVETVLLSYG